MEAERISWSDHQKTKPFIQKFQIHDSVSADAHNLDKIHHPNHTLGETWAALQCLASFFEMLYPKVKLETQNKHVC